MGKYGCITGVPRSVMLPVAASQYINRSTGAFVHLDTSGHVTTALTANTYLYGYVGCPAGHGAGTSDNYWLSSATAGADKIPVIRVSDDVEFLMPADDTVTQAYVGRTADLVSVNDGTVQNIDIGTTSTDLFLIQAIGTAAGGTTTDIVVKINPAKVQALTN